MVTLNKVTLNEATLIKAALSDLDLILEMATAFHIEDGHPLKSHSKDTLQKILTEEHLGQIYIIHSGQDILGYFVLCFTMSVEFGGLVVILDDFYIQPQFRGKGLGKEALNSIIRIAQEMNCVQIFLEVEHQNTKARRLYEQFDFKVRERHMMSLDFI